MQAMQAMQAVQAVQAMQAVVLLPRPAGRLTPVRAFLWFVCLFALMPQPAAKPKPCTRDIIQGVELLIRKTSNLWSDCRLYTPTMDDYKKCPVSTMKCFADEVKVLIEESENVLRGFRLNIQLEKLASFLNQTTITECPQCELCTEQKAEKFLSALLLTLKTMNFQRC